MEADLIQAILPLPVYRLGLAQALLTAVEGLQQLLTGQAGSFNHRVVPSKTRPFQTIPMLTVALKIYTLPQRVQPEQIVPFAYHADSRQSGTGVPTQSLDRNQIPRK